MTVQMKIDNRAMGTTKCASIMKTRKMQRVLETSIAAISSHRVSTRDLPSSVSISPTRIEERNQLMMSKMLAVLFCESDTASKRSTPNNVNEMSFICLTKLTYLT